MNGKVAKFLRAFTEYDGTPESREVYQAAKRTWKQCPRDERPALRKGFIGAMVVEKAMDPAKA